jgi:hypothetical protein
VAQRFRDRDAIRRFRQALEDVRRAGLELLPDETLT